MRVERILLEHEGDVALGRLQPGRHPAADLDGAAIRLLEPGDQPQRRGLAGAGRPEQHDELAVGDRRGRDWSTAAWSPKRLADAVRGRPQPCARSRHGWRSARRGPRPCRRATAARRRARGRPSRRHRTPHVGRHARLDHAVGGLDRHDLRGAEIFGAKDLAAQLRGIVEADVLGPDAERHARRAPVLAHFRHRDTGALDRDFARALGQSALERQEVHRRRADEVGDEHRGRPVIDFLRRAELLDDAMVHDGDLVGHRHGFHLVMRDIDGGGADAVVQLAQLVAPSDRGTRRRACRAARPSGSTSAGARWRGRARRAGGRRRRGPRPACRADGRCAGARRLLDALPDLGARHALRQQREADVLAHVHVRIEREELEHEGDVALAGALAR